MRFARGREEGRRGGRRRRIGWPLREGFDEGKVASGAEWVCRWFERIL
jgi:hypothetical protein